MPDSSKSILRIIRKGGYANRMRSFKMFLDNTQIGVIAANSVLEVSIQPGVRVLQARIDWCRSAPITINAVPGQISEIEVASNFSPGLALWAITFAAKRYLKLTPHAS